MTSSQKLALEVTNVSRVFRSSEVVTNALSSVSLRVNQGEFCAIMGPSGCGKTTLLSILGLLDIPTSGSYCLLNKQVARLPEKKLAALRRRHIGFVFQNFNLIDRVSVWENVVLPLNAGFSGRKEARRKAEAILSLVGIENRSNHLPKQLSGGQQQRVAIARALICNPDLIIADEPTGNLDSSTGSSVLDLLQEIRSLGKTIVMVTHSERDAKRASRVVRMADGKII